MAWSYANFLIMDKSGVTDILEEIAVLLELKGENPFKARAYTNAARALDNFEGDLATLVAENRLGDLPGLGDALQKKITELVTTGRLKYYEDLRASVPEGLLALMDIPSLGAKKIKVLHEKLEITSVAELEAACVAHQVRDLAGFGAKTEEKLLAGIAQARDYSALQLYADAWSQAEEIREALRDHEDVIQLSVAGSPAAREGDREGPRFRRIVAPARGGDGLFCGAAVGQDGDQSRPDQIKRSPEERDRGRFARGQRQGISLRAAPLYRQQGTQCGHAAARDRAGQKVERVGVV